MHPIVEFVVIGILVCFTAIITAMAIIAGGALIYYYETNKIVYAFEVVSGVTATVLACVMMYERLVEYFRSVGRVKSKL